VVFLFRDRSLVNIVFLVLLSIAVHAHGFSISLPLVAQDQDGYFSFFMNRYLKAILGSANFLVYLIIILTQAIRLNFLLAEQKMFPGSGYTVAMTYILLTGLLPQWAAITPALLANYALIWIYIKFTRLYNHPSPKTLLFNIGLLVSVTIFCYHPTATMVLVVLFALAIMRPFKLQEWFTLLMGVALPFYFLASWLYLNNALGKLNDYLPQLAFALPVKQLNSAALVGLIALAFVLLVGFFYWQQFNSRLVIQMRKNWAALLVMCFILTAAPFVFYNAGLTATILCLVPFTAFVSAAFSYPKRLFLPNLLFFILVGVIVYNNWHLVKF
jgi:hypothetical protein